MDHNIDRTQSKASHDPAPDNGFLDNDQTNDKQDLIYLPAIEIKEHKPAPDPIQKKQAPHEQQTEHKKPADTVSNELQDVPEYLPEYQAPTNGLRELLSTFDPDDLASHTANTSKKSDFETRIKASLIENDTDRPLSAPGLPASPDLPTGPTRWGLYLSGMIGGLAFLFVVALSYAHMSSPTGIDWAKAKSGTAQMWHKLANSWSRDKAPAPHATRTAEFSLPEPLQIDTLAGEALNGATSRISTTAATPKKGSIATPSASEIFISQKELEKQILSLEARQADLTKRPRTAANHRIRTANRKNKRRNPPEFDELAAIPSIKITPDMESKFFRRAKSYLQQHDISSARMILQYAASQGSGLSAMALAETYDPHFAQRINLPNLTTSRADARKWYYMASRLGIKSANARLKALK